MSRFLGFMYDPMSRLCLVDTTVDIDPCRELYVERGLDHDLQCIYEASIRDYRSYLELKYRVNVIDDNQVETPGPEHWAEFRDAEDKITMTRHMLDMKAFMSL